MNKTSAILQSSTSVTGRQFAISQPAQSRERYRQPCETDSATIDESFIRRWM